MPGDPTCQLARLGLRPVFERQPIPLQRVGSETRFASCYHALAASYAHHTAYEASLRIYSVDKRDRFSLSWRFSRISSASSLGHGQLRGILLLFPDRGSGQLDL